MEVKIKISKRQIRGVLRKAMFNAVLITKRDYMFFPMDVGVVDV